MMKFTITQEEISLTYTMETIGEDSLITVTGGDAHIGSVAVVFDGTVTALKAESHQDHFLTVPLAKALVKDKSRRFVVVGGFHLDDITKEQIKTVLELHEKGIKKLLTFY